MNPAEKAILKAAQQRENFADMNRQARRAMGSPWRWDRQITGEAGVRASRFERRHMTLEAIGERGSFSHPKTRRQRKRNARVKRILAAAS